MANGNTANNKKSTGKSAFERSQQEKRQDAAIAEMNRLLQDNVDFTRNAAKNAGLMADEIMDMVDNFVKFKDIGSAVLQIENQIVAAEKAGKTALAETLKIQRKVLQIEKERLAIEKRIGDIVTDQTNAITGFMKKIPIIGNLLEKNMKKKIADFSRELSIAMVEGQGGFKSMGSIAVRTFGKRGLLMLGIAAIGAALYGLYKLMSDIDEVVSNTAKSLGMSKDSVITMAEFATSMGVSFKSLLANVQGINSAFGGINVINDKNINQFEDQLRLANTLQRGFGLTSEEIGAMTNNADLMGSSLERVTYEVMNTTASLQKSGIYLSNQNQVMKDIAKMSKFNAAHFGKSATSLAKAATASRLLGRDIESVLNSNEASLDIENSIAKEMRARALTGKDINYDSMRNAQLNGDALGVIRAQIAAFKQVGKVSDLLPMQAAAFAESMHMSKDEAEQMSNNLILAERAGLDLEKFLSGKISLDEMKAARKNLSKEEQVQFDAMMTQMQATSIQQEFNEALEAVKASLLPLLGPLSTLLTGIAKLVKGFSDITGGFGPLVVGAVMLYKGFMSIRRAMQAVVALGEQAMLANQALEPANGGGGGLGGGGGNAGRSGRRGGMSRIGTAFRKGGIRGGAKAMGRMVSGGMASIGATLSGAQANLGVGTGTTAGATAGSTSAVGSVANKGGILGKLGNALKGGFGKALGPIFNGIMGIAGIASMVSDARANAASGNAQDPGSLGKNLVQSAAYPIANLALNLIPGFGTIASLADGVMSMMGISILEWLTDNLIGLIPDSSFAGLGKMALGDSATATASAPPAEVKVNDFMLDTHPNDKIGGVLDNGSVERMISLLEQQNMLLSERQQVVIGDGAVEAINRRGAARKSFRNG